MQTQIFIPSFGSLALHAVVSNKCTILYIDRQNIINAQPNTVQIYITDLS